MTIRLCRYSAVNLKRSVLLAPRRADQAATLYNALKPFTQKQRHTFSSCFFDEPQPVVALITYRAERTLRVFSSIGCGDSTTNGFTSRGEPEAARVSLYTLLEQDTDGPTDQAQF